MTFDLAKRLFWFLTSCLVSLHPSLAVVQFDLFDGVKICLDYRLYVLQKWLLDSSLYLSKASFCLCLLDILESAEQEDSA